MQEFKVYKFHGDICDFLDIPPEKGLADLEFIYRPDAERWLIVGKTFDKDEETLKEEKWRHFISD